LTAVERDRLGGCRGVRRAWAVARCCADDSKRAASNRDGRGADGDW